MSIKWSALQVNEAMDMVEDFINEASASLEKASIVVKEAGKIPNLPQYINERLVTLGYSINRIQDVRRCIKVVRDTLPDGAVEDEKKRLANGSQLTLAA